MRRWREPALSETAAGGQGRPHGGTGKTTTRFNLSLSAQNCNSLNVASCTKAKKHKLTAIMELRTNIILLSDVRIGIHVNKVKDFLKLHYRLYGNSTMSKRGVAILIKNGTDFQVESEIKDRDENILLLVGKSNGNDIVIGAVYGPNDDDNDFFNFLKVNLQQHHGKPIILGGDWNTTVSADNSAENLDVFNMRSVPSQVRTGWLLDMITNLDLFDVFRNMNPRLRDYTHIPFGNVRNNKSRIDYFLASCSLLDSISSTTITNGYCSKIFDHKAVHLTMGKIKSRGRKAINNRIMFHPLFRFTVLLAVYETYISYVRAVQGGVIDNLLGTLCNQLDGMDNDFSIIYKQCDSWSWKATPPDQLEARQRALLNIENVFSNIMQVDELENLPRTIDDDDFFEKLVGAINKHVLLLQAKSSENEHSTEKGLSSWLLLLKRNYVDNSNEIKVIEDTLNSIMEERIRDKAQNYLKDELLNDSKILEPGQINQL